MAVGSIPTTSAPGHDTFTEWCALLNTELAELYARAPVPLTSITNVNAIEGTATPVVVALAAGMSFQFTAVGNNTGNVTLKVGTLAAFPVKTPDGGEIAPNGLRNGGRYTVLYDGAVGYVSGVGLGASTNEFDWIHSRDGNDAAIDFTGLGSYATIEFSGVVEFASASTYMGLRISKDGLTTDELMSGQTFNLNTATAVQTGTSLAELNISDNVGATTRHYFAGRIQDFKSTTKQTVITSQGNDTGGDSYSTVAHQNTGGACDSIGFQLENNANLTGGHITIRGFE